MLRLGNQGKGGFVSARVIRKDKNQHVALCVVLRKTNQRVAC